MCCRKGDPFQAPKLGSCLTLGNESSKETHVLTKQEILVGKGARVESCRVREPRRTALPLACSLGFYGDGISFQVVFSQSFWLRVLPGGARLVWSRWMLERILGGCRTCGVSFWPFLNSSSWWRLISSVFLTRTSCCKTTHANGYYGAWPGWAVSISVLPLTHAYHETFKITELFNIENKSLQYPPPVTTVNNLDYFPPDYLYVNSSFVDVLQ